ncbi:hypothetical protein MRB53_039689 [Persea americana]|nr:hypothetical protein MRB53_039689 [Persea americana]
MSRSHSALLASSHSTAIRSICSPSSDWRDDARHPRPINPSDHRRAPSTRLRLPNNIHIFSRSRPKACGRERLSRVGASERFPRVKPGPCGRCEACSAPSRVAGWGVVTRDAQARSGRRRRSEVVVGNRVVGMGEGAECGIWGVWWGGGCWVRL